MNLPLIDIAAGKKPRTPRVGSPKEVALHMTTAKLLREHCLPDWRWTHIPSGEIRDVRTAAKLKQMGLQRGWPDFLMVAPEGSIRCLELKRVGARLTYEQEVFKIWCGQHGVPYCVAYTVDEVLKALGRWGCLRIKVS